MGRNVSDPLGAETAQLSAVACRTKRAEAASSRSSPKPRPVVNSMVATRPTSLRRARASKPTIEYVRHTLASSSLAQLWQAQAIAPVEVLDAIFEAFRQPLPTTFRVTGSRACIPAARASALARLAEQRTGTSRTSTDSLPRRTSPSSQMWSMKGKSRTRHARFHGVQIASDRPWPPDRILGIPMASPGPLMSPKRSFASRPSSKSTPACTAASLHFRAHGQIPELPRPRDRGR
jgi:hypothetical protein